MSSLKWILAFGFLCGVGFTSNAFAQAKAAGGGGGGVTTGPFEAYLSGGFIGMASSASEFELSPGFQFKPFSSLGWLQVGGEITYQKLSHQGGSTKNMMVLGGFTVNLSGATVNEAAFVSLGIADRSGSSDVQDTTSVSPDGIGYYFMAGKRFPFSGGWSYRPTVGIVNTGASAFIFRPLAISYHF